jgi:hypothetical protein
MFNGKTMRLGAEGRNVRINKQCFIRLNAVAMSIPEGNKKATPTSTQDCMISSGLGLHAVKYANSAADGVSETDCK